MMNLPPGMQVIEANNLDEALAKIAKLMAPPNPDREAFAAYAKTCNDLAEQYLSPIDRDLIRDTADQINAIFMAALDKEVSPGLVEKCEAHAATAPLESRKAIADALDQGENLVSKAWKVGFSIAVAAIGLDRLTPPPLKLHGDDWKPGDKLVVKHDNGNVAIPGFENGAIVTFKARTADRKIEVEEFPDKTFLVSRFVRFNEVVK